MTDLTITTTICDEDDFRCSDGKCIKMSARCDNWQDCVYGEDEANCSSDDAESGMWLRLAINKERTLY